jgi:hypothetical protein
MHVHVHQIQADFASVIQFRRNIDPAEGAVFSRQVPSFHVSIPEALRRRGASGRMFGRSGRRTAAAFIKKRMEKSGSLKRSTKK